LFCPCWRGNDRFLHAGAVQWPAGAKELEQKRDYQALLDYSRKWIGAEITNPLAWYILGVAHYKLGQFPNAADAFRESVRLQPDDARAWYNLGVSCDDLGQFSNAVNAYREAVRLYPGYASAWYNLGGAYSNLKQYPAAMDAFQEAKRLNPQDPFVWSSLGTLYNLLGRHADALEAFREAVRLKPDDERGWYGIGISYAKLGQHAKAVDAYQRSIRLKPNEPTTWYNLGVAYGNLGQYADGVKAYREALRFKPDDAATWSTLGLAYSILGQHDNAVDAYLQGSGSSRGIEHLVQPGGFLRRPGPIPESGGRLPSGDQSPGSVYLGVVQPGDRLQQTRPARQRGECLPRGDPPGAGGSYRVVQRRKFVRENGPVLQCGERVSGGDPPQAGPSLRLDQPRAVYVNLGDYSKAAEACREAIRLKPDDARAWYHLGAANAKMGRREDALVSYNKLKQLDISLANEYFEKVVFLGAPLPAVERSTLATRPFQGLEVRAESAPTTPYAEAGRGGRNPPLPVSIPDRIDSGGSVRYIHGNVCIEPLVGSVDVSRPDPECSDKSFIFITILYKQKRNTSSRCRPVGQLRQIDDRAVRTVPAELKLGRLSVYQAHTRGYDFDRGQPHCTDSQSR